MLIMLIMIQDYLCRQYWLCPLPSCLPPHLDPQVPLVTRSLGCPHQHLRRLVFQLCILLDVLASDYFKRRCRLQLVGPHVYGGCFGCHCRLDLQST